MFSALNAKVTRKNNRKALRFSININASYFICNDWRECAITNISDQGMAIISRQSLKRDDVLKLRISFQNQSAMINARVVYCVGMKTGMAFEESNGNARRAFLDIMDAALIHKARTRIQVRDCFTRLKNHLPDYPVM